MTTILVSNNAATTLAGSITNVATTAILATGSGVEFPSPGAGQFYIGSFKDAATGLVTEIVHVTAMSGDTITTMVRAQEGTSALPWAAGDLFINLMTAGSFQALAQAGDTQRQAGNWVTDTGSANAYVATLSPAVLSYTAGLTVRLLVANANSTAATLNVNGLGTKAIEKPTSGGIAALTGGELVAGQIAELVYDGTQFQLLSVYSSATVANVRLNAWGGTAGGSANAITVTDAPVLTAYSAGQQVSFIAANNNSGATTINCDGLGTKNIYKISSSGPVALAGGEIVANNIVTLVYDGTEFQMGNSAASGSSASVGPVRNLIIKNNTSTPNTKMSVTADSIPVFTSAGAGVGLLSVSVTIDATTNGANGLDTGSLAASTWYAIYLIYNGSSVAGLMSTSGSAPTLPSGYTYFTRYGWVHTDGSTHFLNNGCTLRQTGNRAQYINAGSGLPALITGASGSLSVPTWTGVPVGAFIPPTAATIVLFGIAFGAGGVLAAPNNSYGPELNISNPPPINLIPTNTDTASAEWVLESTNVYYAASGASTGIFCIGWTDNL